MIVFSFTSSLFTSLITVDITALDPMMFLIESPSRKDSDVIRFVARILLLTTLDFYCVIQFLFYCFENIIVVSFDCSIDCPAL